MYDSIHQSLLEIVGFMNRPSQDEVLLQRAGVSLEQALFPLLIVISHKKPIGIVELAGYVNKDYSTVSRQVDKLVQRGLVATKRAEEDRRIRMLVTTPAGKAMIEKIRHARRQLMQEVLKNWSDEEIVQLEETLKHVVDSLETRSF